MSIHIGAKPGEIADRVLMPGDPLRAKHIAETFLEGAVCYTQVRGMYGFTGTYKGKRVSVQGSGMGMPSMHIYASELMPGVRRQTDHPRRHLRRPAGGTEAQGRRDRIRGLHRFQHQQMSVRADLLRAVGGF